MTITTLPRLLFAVILMAVFAVHGASSEALHFDRLACDLTPTDTDLAGVATFPFVNVSPVPVTIMMVQASCPCVKPRLEKMTYQPGEHGEVVVDAEFGSMTGVQRRRLEIVSDHIASRSTIVEVVMHLPPGPQFTPLVQHWQLGEQPGTRAIAIHLPDGFSHRLVGVTSSQPAVTATLVPAISGVPARLDIAVADTSKAKMAIIQVAADTGKSYSVFIQIGEPDATPPPPAAGAH